MVADSNICLRFYVWGEWDQWKATPRPWLPEEAQDEVPVVVYSAGAVLAAGPGGPGALSAGLAVPAALPVGGDRRGRRPRPGLGDCHPARPHAPRALVEAPPAPPPDQEKWPRHGPRTGRGHCCSAVSYTHLTLPTNREV